MRDYFLESPNDVFDEFKANFVFKNELFYLL